MSEPQDTNEVAGGKSDSPATLTQRTPKIKNGEWVQDYTRRGAPRQGYNQYRWRSNSEKKREIVTGFVIAAAIILAVVLPVVISAEHLN